MSITRLPEEMALIIQIEDVIVFLIGKVKKTALYQYWGMMETQQVKGYIAVLILKC